MSRSVTASATQRLDLVAHNRWITPTVCVHELICTDTQITNYILQPEVFYAPQGLQRFIKTYPMDLADPGEPNLSIILISGG